MSKVSCIIPTLNEEKHIESCIESLRNQNFPFEDMEIIVADGGSTDTTRDIVLRLSDKCPNVRLVDNPGKIQSCAFNVGVSESSAPYVLRMDAHVLYSEDYIQRCILYLENDENIGNVGGRCIIKASEDSIMAKANAILNHSRFGIGNSDFRVGDKARETDTVPFGAFRRETLEIVGGMREDLPRGEDNEFNSRIIRYGYKIWFDPDITSIYYARPSLISSARQMFLNGVSIAWLLKVDRQSVRLRHLVPLVFIVSIPLTCGLSLGAYILAAIVADFRLCRDEGFKYFFPLLLLFPAIHLSYGVGTICGFLSILRDYIHKFGHILAKFLIKR